MGDGPDMTSTYIEEAQRDYIYNPETNSYMPPNPHPVDVADHAIIRPTTHYEFPPGRKDDQGKPDMSLVPLDAVLEVAKVLTFGAAKYEPNSWQRVPDAKRRYLAALLRHLTDYQSGETADPESGLLHLAHAATNALFLVWLEKHT